MIQRVISRGDAPEHFPDMGGGIDLRPSRLQDAFREATQRRGVTLPCSGSGARHAEPAATIGGSASTHASHFADAFREEQIANVLPRVFCRPAWPQSERAFGILIRPRRQRTHTRDQACNLRRIALRKHPTGHGELCRCNHSPAHGFAMAILAIARHALERVSKRMPEVEDFAQAGLMLVLGDHARFLRDGTPDDKIENAGIAPSGASPGCAREI